MNCFDQPIAVVPRLQRQVFCLSSVRSPLRAQGEAYSQVIHHSRGADSAPGVAGAAVPSTTEENTSTRPTERGDPSSSMRACSFLDSSHCEERRGRGRAWSRATGSAAPVERRQVGSPTAPGTVFAGPIVDGRRSERSRRRAGSFRAATIPRSGRRRQSLVRSESRPGVLRRALSALLCRRSPDRPIGLRLIDVAGLKARFASEEESGFAQAEVPVAAVEARDGETPALCVGLVEVTDPNHRSWTEVRRFVHTAAGRWARARARQWVSGEQASIDGANASSPLHAAHRMSLLWRCPSRASRRAGRLYHFSGRGTTADRPWSEQFITMEAPVRETGTGWFSPAYFAEAARAASAA